VAAPDIAVAAASTPDAAAADARPDVLDERLDCWARLVAGYLRAHAAMEQADELWFAG
jgi:hypothetical protein